MGFKRSKLSIDKLKNSIQKRLTENRCDARIAITEKSNL